MFFIRDDAIKSVALWEEESRLTLSLDTWGGVKTLRFSDKREWNLVRQESARVIHLLQREEKEYTQAQTDKNIPSASLQKTGGEELKKSGITGQKQSSGLPRGTMGPSRDRSPSRPKPYIQPWRNEEEEEDVSENF